MLWNNDLTKGILIGVGVSALGFYLYKKKEDKVDEFLRKQGVAITPKSTKDFSTMSVEELMETKEILEDLIAEKEMESQQVVVACSPSPDSAPANPA